MSNQPTPITDDEIRSVLYRMAAHVSFFAEPRTPDPKASAFADALMSAVRPSVQKAEPPADTPTNHRIGFVIEALKQLISDGLIHIPDTTTIREIFDTPFNSSKP